MQVILQNASNVQQVNALALEELQTLVAAHDESANLQLLTLNKIHALTTALLEFNVTRNITALYNIMQKANVSTSTLDCINDIRLVDSLEHIVL